MKNLRMILIAVVCLSFLAPTGVLAQGFVAQSEIGLFIDESDLTIFTAAVDMDEVDIYLILMNPYFNEDLAPGAQGTVPVVTMGAWELRLEMPANCFLTDAVYPLQHLDIAPYPDFTVAYAAPLPLVDGQVTLATFSVFVDDDGEAPLFLSPNLAHSTPLEGLVGYGWDADGNDEEFEMFPISGAHDAPVFIFNPRDGGPVATEAVNWGNVKALYR